MSDDLAHAINEVIDTARQIYACVEHLDFESMNVLDQMGLWVPLACLIRDIDCLDRLIEVRRLEDELHEDGH